MLSETSARSRSNTPLLCVSMHVCKCIHICMCAAAYRYLSGPLLALLVSQYLGMRHLSMACRPRWIVSAALSRGRGVWRSWRAVWSAAGVSSYRVLNACASKSDQVGKVEKLEG